MCKVSVLYLANTFKQIITELTGSELQTTTLGRSPKLILYLTTQVGKHCYCFLYVLYKNAWPQAIAIGEDCMYVEGETFDQ